MTGPAGERRKAVLSHPGAALFLASFIALFLELLLIRWVPSLVRVMAYYGNLMLISSFLGLGCGLLLTRRRLSLQRWFGPLLLILVLLVFVLRGVTFEQGPDELRFLFRVSGTGTTFPIAFIFVLNALLFVPLGELIGAYFERLPPLHAYSWDLGGAIAGTVAFGLFSYFWFSPLLGFAAVMALYLFYCRGARLVLAGLCFAATLVLLVFSADRSAIWSPYNHITVREAGGGSGSGHGPEPPHDLASMQDPPYYVVQVNSDFYMVNGTIDTRRYSEPGGAVSELAEQYSLPYRIRPEAEDVLVVGSGGGLDVEAALLHGARSVDAVEIDPVIIRLGRRYSASAAYDHPRVSTHNTDARAYLRQAEGPYDMVVFGFLDSQSLFSQMSSVRLDGYVYTVESLREAFRLLRPGGLLSVSFFSAGRPWLTDRLVTIVGAATGAPPLVYGRSAGEVVILAGKDRALDGPERFDRYERLEWASLGTSASTDDWPYLYLRQRLIPSDYLTNITVLVAISLMFVLWSSGRGRRRIDLHFFFLGAGFLLLETKSITTLSLFFGTTWLVSTIVILGVLLMVLFANLVALRLRRFSLLYYVPLMASIGFLYLFPNQYVLGWSYTGRLAYSLLVIPLPIFFAGLIFSSSLRLSNRPSFALGSNLLGAMIGGFCEYMGMITGLKALLLIVLAFYAASLSVTRLSGRWQSARAAGA